jgi:16S rRNA (adenine1518-N6/adenine1519-N6)-dimethyltransferase
MLSKAEILSILRNNNVLLDKKFGQNFVIDPNVILKIVKLSKIEPNNKVLEIGAGIGNLTLGLLEKGAEVVAVERDPKLIPILLDLTKAYGNKIKVIQGDFLKMEPLDFGPDGFLCMGNLPYNVGIPILFKLFKEWKNLKKVVVMLQYELVEKICRINKVANSSLAAKLGILSEAKLLSTLNPTVFFPEPKVRSAIVELIPKTIDGISRCDLNKLLEFIDDGFSHPRKMLKNSFNANFAEHYFENAGIDPKRRPSTLNEQEWTKLYKIVSSSGE